MLFTFITYFLPVIQILFPLYYLYRLWAKNYKNKISWLIEAAVCIGFVIFFYFVGRWDIVGYMLRYILYSVYAFAGCLSFYRVKELPFYDKRSFSWSSIPDFVIILGLIAWVFTGFSHDKKALNISFPLQGDSYCVVQGGAAYPLNYHGAFANTQRYALDITQLNKWGLRASGIYPSNLSKYQVYGNTVYSPIAGEIVNVVDTLKDLSPPNRFPTQPTGNHIWIKKENIYLVLAHLKQSSVLVKEGDNVRVNEPVAKVGNSGNTSEPHLHIHAVRSNGSEIDHIYSLSKIGEAIPLHIQNNFLIRNNTINNTE